MLRCLLLGVSYSLILLAGARAEPQGDVPRPYDGIDAGEEAHRIHEAQRIGRIGRQLELSESAKEGFTVDPWTFYDGPAWGNYFYEPPLSPWNLRYEQYPRQPIGHRSLQFGTTRWEYHPIFEDQEQQELSPLAPKVEVQEIIPEPAHRAEARPRRNAADRPLQRREHARPSGPREF